MTQRPPSELAKLSRHERAFWLHWLKKTEHDRENRWWERFGRQLGTLWYREDFESKKTSSVTEPARDPDRAFYPLSVLISPNSIHKQIKEGFERQKSKVEGYVAQDGEEIVSIGELDAAEYRAFMQRLNEGLGGA